MKNKKTDARSKVIIYLFLVIFGMGNIVLCRLAYVFFGIDSEFIAIFLNSIVIIFTSIFLSFRNMLEKKNIIFLRILGITTIIVYPIVITISQLFSLFEFQGIIFDINKFSIFKDTYIFLNIPLCLVILIASSRFQKVID